MSTKKALQAATAPRVTKALLTPDPEVMHVTGLGRTTIYKLIATGEIPSVRIGRAVRVPAAALQRWLEERAGCTLPPVVAAVTGEAA